MNAAPKTLRHLSELTAAGLAPASRRAALEKVAAQYAVAITPAMAELIDTSDPHDPIARQFVPDAAELETQPQERADPIGDHAHSPVDGVVHRYPDRALLKLTATCAVYCRFCFRREMVGPGAESAVAAAARRRARLHRRAPGNLGGHPDRRRPAGAVAAPAQAGDDAACRDRPCQGRPRPHPHSGRRAVARHAGAGEGAASERQGHLRGAARQPCARAHARGTRRLRAPDRRRHPDAEPVGAARGRQRRCGDARRADARARRMPHQAVLPAPRRSRAWHVAPANLDRARPGVDASNCAAGIQGCASPSTCSTFQAVTASRRSGRAICARTGRAVTASRISTAACTAIRRRP